MVKERRLCLCGAPLYTPLRNTLIRLVRLCSQVLLHRLQDLSQHEEIIGQILDRENMFHLPL